MKKNVLLALISATFLFTSCNNETKEKESSENVTENDLTNKLIVKIEGVFPKNDQFQLFYSSNDQFEESNSLSQVVYGQSVLQTLVFELPKDKKPQSLRLDLGANPAQTSVTIKDITIEYNGEKLENEPGKFRELFGDTFYTVYDSISLEYKLQLNDQNVFDPMLIGTDKLKRSLNKLYNSSKQNEAK